MFSAPQGLQSLLKDGGKHFTGVEEAVMKNIEAVKKLSTITRTSLGPNSMNKLLINFLEKHFVTSDAATIVNELEVVHPAAKMVVEAAKMQEEEYGDATNFVVVFAGELLSAAEALLKMGLHTADVIKGYEVALQVATEKLKEQTVWKLTDPRDKAQLVKAIKTAISSKQLGQEEHLAGLVADAVLKVVPEDAKTIELDNVRVARLGGGTFMDSHVIYGMVVGRDANGTEKIKKDCNVMVLGAPLELGSTETKGTVLLKTAEELAGFTKGEEEKMEEHIREIKDAGVDVIVANGTISDIAQHFCNKYEIMVVRVPSKWDTRRICRTLGAQALARLGAPTAEEIGKASLVEVREIGSHYVTVIEAADSKVATILLRGATANGLEEVERSIDDASHVAKAACKTGAFVAGAGATEIELSLQVQSAGRALTGLEQYAVIRFAEALECVPRILAENAGQLATETMTALVAAHQAGRKTAGVNVEFSSGVSGAEGVLDAVEHEIFDHLETKEWALRLATDAALTVLRVDQIIMSKPAGGPKPKENPNWDEKIVKLLTTVYYNNNMISPRMLMEGKVPVLNFEDYGRDIQEVFNVDRFEGFRLQTRRPVNPYLNIEHTLNIANGTKKGYEYSIAPQFAYPDGSKVMFGRWAMGENSMARFMWNGAQSSSSVMLQAMEGPQGAMCFPTYEYTRRFDNMVLNAKAMYQNIGIFSAAFSQRVSPSAQVGAELTHILQGPGMTFLTIGSHWRKDKNAVHVQYSNQLSMEDGQNHTELKASFVRAESQRTKLGADLSVNVTTQESTLKLGYQATLNTAMINVLVDTAGSVESSIRGMNYGAYAKADFFSGQYKAGFGLSLAAPEGQDPNAQM